MCYVDKGNFILIARIFDDGAAVSANIFEVGDSTYLLVGEVARSRGQEAWASLILDPPSYTSIQLKYVFGVSHIG